MNDFLEIVDFYGKEYPNSMTKDEFFFFLVNVVGQGWQNHVITAKIRQKLLAKYVR